MGSEREVDTDQAWEVGWEDARERQQRDIAKATPTQLLDWLEEAISIAAQSGALPRKRGVGT